MKPNKVQFQDGTLVTPGYCEIGGVRYNTHEPEYSGTTPFSAYNLNKVQSEILADIENNENNIGSAIDTFDEESAYRMGDVVVYMGKLWYANINIDMGGEFDARKWNETNLIEIIDRVNNKTINYATGYEQQTNEYIDGHRIYKKYVSGTTQSGNSSIDLFNGVDMIIEDCIYIQRNNGQWHRATYGAIGSVDANHISPVFLQSGTISLYIKNSQYQNRPFKGFIKYTKVEAVG